MACQLSTHHSWYWALYYYSSRLHHSSLHQGFRDYSHYSFRVALCYLASLPMTEGPKPPLSQLLQDNAYSEDHNWVMNDNELIQEQSNVCIMVVTLPDSPHKTIGSDDDCPSPGPNSEFEKDQWNHKVHVVYWNNVVAKNPCQSPSWNYGLVYVCYGGPSGLFYSFWAQNYSQR